MAQRARSASRQDPAGTGVGATRRDRGAGDRRDDLSVRAEESPGLRIEGQTLR
jgi:hypothetical protein